MIPVVASLDKSYALSIIAADLAKNKNRHLLDSGLTY